MSFNPDQMVHVLMETVLTLVRADGPDLSARQLGVMLTCYLDPKGDHTVRGLAEKLDVSKPAITRALDRLEDLALAERKADPRDRRSVVVSGTVRGDSFMRDLRAVLSDISDKMRSSEETAAA